MLGNNDNNTLNEEVKDLLNLDRLLGFKQLTINSENIEASALHEEIGRLLNKIGEIV